jgi:class 3 adenylate cyclase/sugar lactone lactonase YvrE
VERGASSYVLPDIATRTVTFLLTDVEGSTRLWQKNPDAMADAIQRHDDLLHEAIGQSGGTVLTERGEGDSFFAVFPGVTDAFAAAIRVQKMIQGERWPRGASIKVRIAVHTGEVRPDYRGPDVNRCARLRSLAHGGQILVTAVTASLGGHHLRGGASLTDLGRYRLRNVSAPEHVFQLNYPDLRTDFPKLSRPVASESVAPPAAAIPVPIPARRWLPSRRIVLGVVALTLAGAMVAALVSVAQVILAGPTISTLVRGGTAALGRPYAIAVDSAGSLYVADADHDEVQLVDATGAISVAAGNRFLVPQLPCLPVGLEGMRECPPYTLGDGKPATEAVLAAPAGVALGEDGTVYIADTNNHLVRKLDANGVITTVAGVGTSGYSGDGGPGVDAQLSAPRSLAFDGQGNLYIADSLNGRVRRLAPDGTISTIAGGGLGGIRDGDPARNATLQGSFAIAADAAGNVYIADAGHNRVRRVSAAGGLISTVAGNGLPGFAGDGGPATEAQLNGPGDIALDDRGRLYIADTGNHRVRMVGNDGRIETLVGTGIEGTSGDGGSARSAELELPISIAVDREGHLYIGTRGELAIRRVD